LDLILCAVLNILGRVPIDLHQSACNFPTSARVNIFLNLGEIQFKGVGLVTWQYNCECCSFLYGIDVLFIFQVVNLEDG